MEVLVIAVGINESVPTFLTNSKRESTIKKSTTHVVSGAFDVVSCVSITSDGEIIGGNAYQHCFATMYDFVAHVVTPLNLL